MNYNTYTAQHTSQPEFAEVRAFQKASEVGKSRENVVVPGPKTEELSKDRHFH